MKPAAFDYVRADSADEVVSLLQQHGADARILAGGQSLMAMLNFRLAQPKLLIDISRCADLNYSRVENGALEIGAAATQASVEWRPKLAAEVPLMAKVFPSISHFQVRNRGTVCGSIAHADPSAELPLCLVALQGEVILRSGTGRRKLAAEDFFQGMLTTALAPGEMVESVRFPLGQPGARYGFEEISMRHGDFALVALAVVVSNDSIALTVGGVSDRPRRKSWGMLSGADLDAALNDFAWELEAESDTHASAEYRRHLVRQLGRKLITGAMHEAL
ncbi:MAG: carbon monoxide dehydrogenase [Herminiimonas sp.]|nr:carbon monoxide dehydrogenase [Herminiimonas sp.]MDB5853085.1 carbon monoxide dehydrogenase [Herminiimonas sp.]